MPSSKQIAYKKGYKYQLAQTLKIAVPIRLNTFINSDFILLENGILTIKKGYAWDGATSAIDTDSFMRGSLVHDALYQLMRENKLPRKYRNAADRILQKLCIEDGMFKLRAWWVYNTVNIMSAKYTVPQARRELLVSPKGEKQ